MKVTQTSLEKEIQECEDEIAAVEKLLAQENTGVVHDIQGFVRKPIAITREYIEYLECRHLTGKTNRSIHEPLYIDCAMDYKRDEQRELDAAYEKAMKAGANFNFKEDLTELEVLINKQIDMDMAFDLTDKEIREGFFVDNTLIAEMNDKEVEEEGSLESGIELVDNEAIWINFIREYFVVYQKDLLLISALKTSMVRQIEKIQTYSMNILLGNFNNSELVDTLFSNIIYINYELQKKVSSMKKWETDDVIDTKTVNIEHKTINRYKFCSFVKTQVNNINLNEFKEIKEFLLTLKVVGELYQNTHDVFTKNEKNKLMKDFMKLTNSNWLDVNIQSNVSCLDLREIISKKEKSEDVSTKNYKSFLSNLDLLDIKSHVLDTFNPQENFIKHFRIKEGTLKRNYANKVAKYTQELKDKKDTEDDLNVSIDSFDDPNLGANIMHGVGDVNTILLDFAREDIENYFKSELVGILAQLHIKYGAVTLNANIPKITELITSILRSFLKLNTTLDCKIKDELLKSDHGETPLFALVNEFLTNYKDHEDSEERENVLKEKRRRQVEKYLEYLKNQKELPDDIDEGFKEDIKDKYKEIQDIEEFEKEYGLYQGEIASLKFCKTESEVQNDYNTTPPNTQKALLEKWKEITAGKTPDDEDYEVTIFGQEAIDKYNTVEEVYISNSDLLIWNILAKTYPDDFENFKAYTDDLKRAKNTEGKLRNINNDYYCLISFYILNLKSKLNEVYTELILRVDAVLPHEKKFLANFINDSSDPSKVDKFLFLNKDYFPIFRMNFPDIEMHTIKNLTSQMDSTIHTIDTELYDVLHKYGGMEVSIVGDEEEIKRNPIPYKFCDYHIPLNMNCRFVSLGFPYRSVLQTFPIIFPEEADDMLKIDTSLSIKFFNTKGGYIEEKTSRGNYKKQYINAPVAPLDGVKRYMGEKQYLIAEALHSIQTPYISGWKHFSYNRDRSHDIDLMFAVDRPYPVTILKIAAKAKLVPHAIK